ncbi:MAG: CCDC90 family protein [Alphaproteobacteria bacterium]
MAAFAFDTLKFVHRLRDAGISEPQAEAIAEAFKDASGEAELATKRDIERLESVFKRDIERLESATKRDIERLELATKRDIERLESATKRDIERLESAFKAEMMVMKWMMGVLLAGVTSLILKAFFPH